MIVLLELEGQFARVRQLNLHPEDDPFLGFSSADEALRFCEGRGIATDTARFVLLRPNSPPGVKAIALFENPKALDEYLAATKPYRHRSVRALRGWAGYLPSLFWPLLRCS